MKEQYIGQRVLITCNSWFVGPDGKDHSAIWGTFNGIYETSKVLGFATNKAHANWFYDISGMLVMGCQVNYLCLCPNKPEPDGYSWSFNSERESKPIEYRTPNKILILE